MLQHEELIEDLKRYVPADPGEERHRQAISSLLTHGPESMWRGHFSPGHITASCFILDDSGQALLLHHHRRLDRWLQMGGHLEPGETAVEAALREGREESGLPDLSLVVEEILDLDVHPIPAGKGEPEHRHFDVRYLARTRMPSRISIDTNESIRLGWIPLGEAAAVMNEEGSSRVLRKIRTLS